MSDLKISQLAAISSLDDDDLLAVVEDGATKKVTVAELRSALSPELGYAETTSNVTVSDTTSPGDLVVSLPEIEFDGATEVEFEWFGTVDTASAIGAEVFLELCDGTSVEIRMADVTSQAANLHRTTITSSYRMTPAAGARTYNVRAVAVGGNGTIRCTPGFPPTYLKATRLA